VTEGVGGRDGGVNGLGGAGDGGGAGLAVTAADKGGAGLARGLTGAGVDAALAVV
jgi:hypothetical protein